MDKHLIIFFNQSLNALIKKGEIVAYYFNPSDVFSKITLIISVNEDIDPKIVAPMFGTAKYEIMYFGGGKDLFKETFAWTNSKLFEVANRISQHFNNYNEHFIIRIYGFNIYCAIGYYLSKILRCSFFISLHSLPNFSGNRGINRLKDKLYYFLVLYKIRDALNNCNRILLVYEILIPYMKYLGLNNFELLRNTINTDKIIVKTNSNLSLPVRLLFVGRQIPGKNPLLIINAIQNIPNVHLTIIGDGELHESCKMLTIKLDIINRVDFIKSLKNDELCSRLHEFDIFVSHTQFPEFPKTVIEAMAAKLPVISNYSINLAPELNQNAFIVDETFLGYKFGINQLIESLQLREKIINSGNKYVKENYNVYKIDEKLIHIYNSC
jgi:glycosyltransferase involved in cell wall biosynthesis